MVEGLALDDGNKHDTDKDRYVELYLFNICLDECLDMIYR